MRFLGRYWRLRISNLITLFLILALAVIVALFSVRYPFEADLTEGGLHTLSAASQAVLAGLEGEVSMTMYVREEQALRQAMQTLIDRYRRHYPLITLQFVNPDTHPDKVKQHRIGRYGELQIRYQDRVEYAMGGEYNITNALERLRRGRQQWVAFLEGHGERSPVATANRDMSIWAHRLNERGFKTQPVNLAHLQTIPSNTKVLVIATPNIALLPGEIDLLGDYVQGGGNLLWLADPGSSHRLESLAEQLEIEFPAGVIIDSASHLVGSDDPTIVLLTSSLYPSHEITNGLAVMTLFPKMAAITANHKQSAWRYSKLLESATHTWLETDVLAEKITYDESDDRLGPLTVGVALERSVGDEAAQRTQRIVVVGDGDFLSNSYLDNGGNMELGLRMINWLSHSDDLIDIPAKTLDDSYLELSMASSFLIGLGFTLILPAIFIVIGVLLWWIRRR